MAIPYLYSMLKSQWPKSFKNGGSGCDDLYLDMNCIFHICLRDAKSVKDFKDLILVHLQMVTAAFRPTKLLYIAIDGVPPIGKLKGQALRRLSYTARNGIDPNALTPGTQFMEMLSQYTRDCTLKISSKLDSSVNIVVSNSSIPGEGELKIINHIREQQDQKKIVIYGIDADLIALTLSLDQREVYLARQRYKRGVTTSRSRQCEYLDVTKLKNEFIGQYSSELRTKLGPGNICKDIVLLLIIMGNDFIPKPRGLHVGFDTFVALLDNLHELHSKTNSTIVQGDRIDHKVFESYLKDFEEYDFSNFKQLTKTNQEAILDEESLSNLFSSLTVTTRGSGTKEADEKDKDIAQAELNRFKKWKTKELEKDCVNGQDHNEIIKEYYKGLHWVLGYYLSECPSNDYIYPYETAPFLSDLVQVQEEVKFTKVEPIAALHQLALVIPKKSSALLPSCYRESKLYDQFSTFLATSNPILITEVNRWITYFKEELDPLRI